MSKVLLLLGIDRPKILYNLTFKEVCIWVAWASLAVLVGMGIANALYSQPTPIAQSSIIQGL